MPNVPSLEDFKAPWETDAGEVDIDKARLKKYIHGLVSDKAQAQTARDTAVTERDALQTQVDGLKAEAEKGDPDSAARLRDLERKLEAANGKAAEAEGKSLRMEVALEKNLTPAQAKRLVGETKEELAADADELIESFGGFGSTETDDDEDDEDEDDQIIVSRQPKRLTNPGDSNSNSGANDLDIEKAIASIPRH